jgi:hypothetical protein
MIRRVCVTGDVGVAYRVRLGDRCWVRALYVASDGLVIYSNWRRRVT